MQQDETIKSNQMKPTVCASLLSLTPNKHHNLYEDIWESWANFLFLHNWFTVYFAVQLSYYWDVAQKYNAHDLVIFSVSLWIRACDWQVVAMAAVWQLSSKRMAVVLLQLLVQRSERWKESYQNTCTVCVFMKQGSSVSRPAAVLVSPGLQISYN